MRVRSRERTRTIILGQCGRWTRGASQYWVSQEVGTRSVPAVGSGDTTLASPKPLSAVAPLQQVPALPPSGYDTRPTCPGLARARSRGRCGLRSPTSSVRSSWSGVSVGLWCSAAMIGGVGQRRGEHEATRAEPTITRRGTFRRLDPDAAAASCVAVGGALAGQPAWSRRYPPSWITADADDGGRLPSDE